MLQCSVFGRVQKKMLRFVFPVETARTPRPSVVSKGSDQVAASMVAAGVGFGANSPAAQDSASLLQPVFFPLETGACVQGHSVTVGGGDDAKERSAVVCHRWVHAHLHARAFQRCSHSLANALIQSISHMHGCDMNHNTIMYT
jgi:hypothetical protein